MLSSSRGLLLLLLVSQTTFREVARCFSRSDLLWRADARTKVGGSSHSIFATSSHMIGVAGSTIISGSSLKPLKSLIPEPEHSRGFFLSVTLWGEAGLSSSLFCFWVTQRPSLGISSTR